MTASQSAKDLRFNFAMPVWGKRYLDVMLNVSLPTQLTERNLLNFPWCDRSIYEFYTTKSDAEEIVESQVFKLLDRTIATHFFYIDEQISASKSKWSALRYCHRQAVQSNDAREAALYFLSPDLIWIEGSLTNAANRIATGYSAVLCPGLRTVEETMVPALRTRFLSKDGCSMPVPARKLVQLGLEHTHPETGMWTWGSPNYFKCPTYILHEVSGEGISAFCYILHPVVLNPQMRHAPFRKIFDQDYLEAACPDVDRIYIAQDSDEVCFFELSPRDVPLPGIPLEAIDKNPYEAMTWYGEWQYNRHHRQFVKKPVRLHYTAITNQKWEAVERSGITIVDQIEQGWNISDGSLLISRPANLYRRIKGRYRFNPGNISCNDAIKSAMAFVFMQFTEVPASALKVIHRALRIPAKLRTRLRKFLS